MKVSITVYQQLGQLRNRVSFVNVYMIQLYPIESCLALETLP